MSIQKKNKEPKEVKLTRLERDYLSSRAIGRLATVNRLGVPHIVPVIYSIGNRDLITISGAGFEKSYKFKNIQENPKVAFVVDSIRMSPWTPLGVEMRGEAKIVTMGNGQKGIEIIPTKIVSWGLSEETVYPPQPTPMTPQSD